MSKFIYVIIGTMCGEAASIDEDCVFDNEETARFMRDKVAALYTDQEFVVDKIDITRFVEEVSANNYSEISSAIETHAGAISEMAKAFSGIREDLHEFLICSCSVDALGNTATHPTFAIRR